MAPQQHGPRDGRGTTKAWGSVSSALTFDDCADFSHVKTTATAANIPPAPAEEAREPGDAVEEKAEPADVETAASGGNVREKLQHGCNAPGSSSLEGVDDGGGDGGKIAEVDKVGPGTLAANADGIPASTSVVASPTHRIRGDDHKRILPRPSTASRRSSSGQGTTIRKPSAAAAPDITDLAAGAAPSALDPTPAAPSVEQPMGQAVAPTREAAEGNSGSKDAAAEVACRGNGYPRNHPRRGRDHNEGGEGEVAAAWWRDALAPTSRRPVTRRSLMCDGGTKSLGCIRGQREEEAARASEPDEYSGYRWSVDGMLCGDEGEGGDRRRSATAAPICGFSTESKHRDLGDFLNRRCGASREETGGK